MDTTDKKESASSNSLAFHGIPASHINSANPNGKTQPKAQIPEDVAATRAATRASNLEKAHVMPSHSKRSADEQAGTTPQNDKAVATKDDEDSAVDEVVYRPADRKASAGPQKVVVTSAKRERIPCEPCDSDSDDDDDDDGDDGGDGGEYFAVERLCQGEEAA